MAKAAAAAAATRPLFACDLTPAEITHRIDAKRCLWCYDQVDMDYSTGFPFHYCVNCRARPEYRHTARRPSYDYKAEHERGIQHLDRLLAEPDHG
jgi:L-amino acid N-acyltransferase YncA